ncbi:hypothetical protein QFZ84_004834 [Pseudomonas fluorescens]
MSNPTQAWKGPARVNVVRQPKASSRYIVERCTPSRRPISEAGRSSAWSVRACSICSGRRTGFGPNRTPRAQAACRPTLVRSEINERSKSAIPAKIVITILPEVDVVSTQGSASDRKPAPLKNPLIALGLKITTIHPSITSRLESLKLNSFPCAEQVSAEDFEFFVV